MVLQEMVSTKSESIPTAAPNNFSPGIATQKAADGVGLWLDAKPSHARVQELPALSSSNSYEHWLFQALDSQTLSVRQLAARILLRHKPPIDALVDHCTGHCSVAG
jgi:hypothetical protein